MPLFLANKLAIVKPYYHKITVFENYFHLKDYVCDVYCKYFVYWLEILVSWTVNIGSVSEIVQLFNPHD